MVNFLRGRSLRQRVLLCLVSMAGVVVAFPGILQAIVTEDPRRDLPIVLDGEVWAVEQVGNAIVVGGNFTQVQTERNGPVVNQAAIFAYDIDSGRFLEDFRPVLRSDSGLVEVRDIEPAPNGTDLYISGRFTSIDDRTDGRERTRNRLALLDIRDGSLDRNFAQAGVNARVLSIDIDRRGNLYAGGNFTEAFDLAPGRPPIIQQVRGLARFDATTGQFDAGFRYETVNDIGRPAFPNGDQARLTGQPSDANLSINFGVARVELSPDNNRLVVAHRGAQIFNRVTGQTRDAGGIAVIQIGNTSHSLTNFEALFPDANDPIQEFYHGFQCSGGGVQIRDLDVQNGWFVVVHQGGDNGVQCDTIVRFPLQDTPARPTWVSRAFDSVFSVEVDGNDIYVGGHFRALVSPSAPSPYPGVQRANRDLSPQTYEADFNGTGPTALLFQQDLVNPGFVFPVGQFGAINATTGYGNPNFDPTSNAALGVLELTSIERGLLIGQDRERINNINVGRSAFLDDAPNSASTNCSVRLNGTGVPVVSWTNIGGVSQWNVAANGGFTGSTDGGGSEFVDSGQGAAGTITYELRYNRNGLSFTDACGSVVVASATLTCTATISGNTVELAWNDAGWSSVSVRRDDRFVTSVSAGTTTFAEPAPTADTTYTLRAFRGGSRTDATCGTVGLGAPVLNCTAAVSGSDVTLTWNDSGWSSVSVRRDDRFVTSVTNGTTFSETVPGGSATYDLRAFGNGGRTDASCGTVTATTPTGPTGPNATCTQNGTGLQWTNVGATQYQVRTDNRWVATVPGGSTTFTLDAAGGDHVIRYRVNGAVIDIDCNG